jgi:cytochrome c biogenesis protein CcmG/thiol:disulfide interchange protein DsbE
MNALKKHPNLLIIGILSLGLVWILTSRSTAANNPNEVLTQPYEGFLAPDLELTTATGESLRLSELRGKPVILNFWASWCPPCRSEMPAIQAVHLAYQDRGLVVLGVNASNQDDLNQANEFTLNMELTFPTLYDTNGTTQKLYAVSALPTTFFIDRSGIIRAIVIGGPMPESLLKINAEEILAQVP